MMENKKIKKEEQTNQYEDDDLSQMVKKNKIRKKVIEKMIEKINSKTDKS